MILRLGVTAAQVMASPDFEPKKRCQALQSGSDYLDTYLGMGATLGVTTMKDMRVIYLATTSILTSAIMLQPAFAQSSTSLLDGDTVANYGGYNGPGDIVSRIPVSDSAVPFNKALHVERKTAGLNSYDAALTWSTNGAVNPDDVLVATFYVRNGIANQKALNLDITFQLSAPPYTRGLATAAPVDVGAWQKYSIPFRADQAYPNGASSFQIRFGQVVQNFDVGGISIANYGPIKGTLPKSLTDTFAFYYPGRGQANAKWRTDALANIEANRKGDMLIRVVDAKDAPIPGATVSIKEISPNFVWSTAISAISLVCNSDANATVRPCPSRSTQLGQTITADDYQRIRRALIDNYSGGSFFNDLKWPEWRNDSRLTLDGMAWMRRNGLPVRRGHTLIWPGFDPDYKLPVEIVNRSTPPSEVRRQIDAHFVDELGTLKGQVAEWDVVNEPYSNFDIQGRLKTPTVDAVAGVLDISAIADWFASARKIDPKAVLFLNDFGIFDAFNPVAQGYDLALTKYIQSRGAPVDGIGFQAHFFQTAPNFADMQQVINDFNPLVKAFSVTEFDFTTLDPKLQADLTEDFMTFIFGQPKFNTFQTWGFWDGDHWLNNGPLYTQDWQLKPSGEVWRRLTLNTWKTQTTATANGSGQIALRAFFGNYAFDVTANGKTCSSSKQFNKSGEILIKAVC